MKTNLVFAFALTLCADMAAAQSRPSTLDRSCAVNRQSVEANGAIVLGTGGFTYDRFVRDRSFCAVDEYTDPAWVLSRDSQACFVGYRCQNGSRRDD